MNNFKKHNINPEEAANLRLKAEEQLKLQKSEANKTVSEVDMLKLIHELEVHQIELEMQNEELVIAREKAELAQEKYTELYDFAPSGYVTLSKMGEILELNFAAARFLGKERLKLIKKRFEFFVSIDTQMTFKQLLQDILTSKVKQSCEVIIATEGNLPIYVNIEGIVSQNDEFCLLTLTDVTEKNLAKIELQSSEEKYRISEFDLKRAQQIAHIGNWTLNIETNELLWSDEIYRIFGCEPQEFEATYEAFLGFIHPDDRERVNSAYLKSLDTKTKYQIEHRIITKNNQIKYVIEKCTTTFNEQGKPLNSFGIVIDITEQKTLENELIKAKEKAEESEAKFRTLVELSSDGISLMDTNGNILFVNQGKIDMFGYDSAENLIGVNGYSLIEEKERQKFFALTPKFLEQGFLANTETRAIRKDGSLIEVEINFRVIYNEKGKPAFVMDTIRDITERKQAENALLAKMDELERFHKLTVGRELTMIDLKKEVNNLLKKLGEDPKYKIVE